ncbi:MAG: hypothetical protein R2912_10940 [Eubacteriales bacterium]
MAIKYVVDVTDRGDSSVVVEEADNNVYLYTGSQTRSTGSDCRKGLDTATAKINGLTGAIIWEKRWICSTGDASASDGIVATPHVGRGQIRQSRDLFVQPRGTVNGATHSETQNPEEAAEASNTKSATQEEKCSRRRMRAEPIRSADASWYMSKRPGSIMWSIERPNDYWASPVVVYDAQGKAYLISVTAAAT